MKLFRYKNYNDNDNKNIFLVDNRHRVIKIIHRGNPSFRRERFRSLDGLELFDGKLEFKSDKPTDEIIREDSGFIVKNGDIMFFHNEGCGSISYIDLSCDRSITSMSFRSFKKIITMPKLKLNFNITLSNS